MIDTILIAVIACLCGLLVWQHWFWSKYTGHLIDKLMSRNYAEYKQVEHFSPLPNSAKTQAPIVSDDVVLNELNSMLGGV